MVISYLPLMLAAFLLVGYSKANLCPNPNFCHTNEIKYRSFKAMSKSYFNSTHVINSLPIKEEKMCLRQCTKSPKCQSINHYRKPSTDQMICDLIDANIYSNASQINQMENSTHYFIKSPCSSDPCKNAGTCIPLYQEGSYKCACTPNNNTVWKFGPHCENLTVSEMTAKIYYNFNSPDPYKDLKSTTGHTLTQQDKNSKAVSVLDRSSPVLFMANYGLAALFSSYGSDCIVHPIACDSGFSLSFWFRILKRTQDNFSLSSKTCGQKYVYPVASSILSSNYGFYVGMKGCTTNAFKAVVRLKTKLYSVNWGSTHDKQLYKKWSHFMLTYIKRSGIIMYFDGLQVAQKLSPRIINSGQKPQSYLRLNKKNHGFEMFMDDVALWEAPLSDSDVAKVFQEGKKRNHQNK